MANSLKRLPLRTIVLLLFASVLLSVPVLGAEEGAAYIKPQGRYKCPVCGMFVAKYPDWIAEIVFKDGSYAIFDGVKDLFKYYFDISTYERDKTRADIGSIIVTDYYTIQPVSGREAFFVLGSDVYGPMGRELIPFEKESAAREFLRDHHGKRVLTFSEVTQEIVQELER